MKTKNLIFFFGILLLFFGCSDNDGKDDNSVFEPPFNNEDCSPDKFGIIEHFSRIGNNDYIFLVKGVVNGQTIESSGRIITVTNDLKGNFTDNSTIVVWGAGGGGGTNTPYNETGEGLWQYSPKDELILLIMKSSWTDDDGIEHEYYSTRGCDRSVLKCSNGNVIGGIVNGYAGFGDVPADTISYEAFVEKINLILSSYEN